jgi:hypothetical protein
MKATGVTLGNDLHANIHRTGVAMRHTGIGRPYSEKGSEPFSPYLRQPLLQPGVEVQLFNQLSFGRIPDG